MIEDLESELNSIEYCPIAYNFDKLSCSSSINESVIHSKINVNTWSNNGFSINGKDLVNNSTNTNKSWVSAESYINVLRR